MEIVQAWTNYYTNDKSNWKPTGSKQSGFPFEAFFCPNQITRIIIVYHVYQLYLLMYVPYLLNAGQGE